MTRTATLKVASSPDSPSSPSGSRDPTLQPFSSTSLWNTAIGSDAQWSQDGDADTQDIFLERMHVHNDNLYEVDGRWEPVSIETEQINIRADFPEILKFEILKMEKARIQDFARGRIEERQPPARQKAYTPRGSNSPKP